MELLKVDQMPAKSSIALTHRTDSTFFNSFLQRFLRIFRGLILTFGSAPSPRGSRPLTPHQSALQTCTIIERNVDSTYIYDLTPRVSPPSRYTRRIYYFAGGSWQLRPGKIHWASCARMVDSLPGTVVSLVSHALAPATQAPETIPLLLQLYGKLVADARATGQTVVIAGDSSGGNIALTLVIQAVEMYPEWPVPAAVLAISPSTDLTRENPDIQKLSKWDPVLTTNAIRQSAIAWRGDWGAKDPRVSPLFASLTSVAEKGIKVHGVTAGFDLLGPDGVLFRKRCEEFGVEGEWLEWDHQMHVFPLLWTYGVKEGYEAFAWIISVLAKT